MLTRRHCSAIRRYLLRTTTAPISLPTRWAPYTWGDILSPVTCLSKYLYRESQKPEAAPYDDEFTGPTSFQIHGSNSSINSLAEKWPNGAKVSSYNHSVDHIDAGHPPSSNLTSPQNDRSSNSAVRQRSSSRVTTILPSHISVQLHRQPSS